MHVCSFCQAHTQQPFGKVIAREDKHGNVQKTYKPAPALRGEEGGCEHCGGTLHVSLISQSSEAIAAYHEGVEMRRKRRRAGSGLEIPAGHCSLSPVSEELASGTRSRGVIRKWW